MELSRKTERGDFCLFQYKIRLRSIGVARIFDWGRGPNHKSHAMTSSETSKEEFFVGAKMS